MYRYYQTGEKSKWISVADDENLDAELEKRKARKLTILSISEEITDQSDLDEVQYRGPLFFDIDLKDDIPQAAASAAELVDRLMDEGVPLESIRIVASGGKGFHIIVKEKAFKTKRPVKNLPLVYMEMAREMHVTGMDYQVYNRGRGTSWRRLHLQRSDGNYPVTVSLEELKEMTTEKYKEIVKHDRLEHPWTAPEKAKVAGGLAKLFDTATKIVGRGPKHSSEIPPEWLTAVKGGAPSCIEKLAVYEIDEARQYNEVAMQFAAWVARAGVDAEVWQPQAKLMAENGRSGQYNSYRARYQHLQGMVAYAGRSSSLKFSCNAMRSVLKVKGAACEGCPIHKAEDEGLNCGILVEAGRYFREGVKAPTQLSTFRLEPVNRHIEINEEGHEIRKGTDMEIYVGDHLLTTRLFDEACWGGRSAFLRSIEGVGDLAWLGNDTDVQRLKHLIYSRVEEMGEITQVRKAGIHLHKVGDKELRVYVEPGMSISELRVRDTHRLVTNPNGIPRLRTVKMPVAGDQDMNSMLGNLLRINSPEVVAKAVGWFCAAHLKTHFMRLYGSFPLLNLWGSAGAGKTVTASILARLNGCDYVYEDSVLTLSSMTKFAVVSTCAETTTIPRLLDEYNKSKMPYTAYNHACEVLKAAWGSASIARGTLTRKSGATESQTGVVDETITSPIVYMSEQMPEVPALLQRSISIQLTRKSRQGSQGYMEGLRRQGDLTISLAKALLTQALSLPFSWVEKEMRDESEKLPDSMTDDRLRHSICVVQVGLSFLRKVCTTLQLPEATYINNLKVDLINELFANEEAAWVGDASEVDAVIMDLGMAAHWCRTNNADQLVVYGTNYAVKGDELYLDLSSCLSGYKLYKKRMGEQVVISNGEQFQQLLQEEPYFAGRGPNKDLGTRLYFILDLNLLQQKGIARENFEE